MPCTDCTARTHATGFTIYLDLVSQHTRSNDEFLKLLVRNSDFAEALVVSCSPALTPPWVKSVIAGEVGWWVVGVGVGG